MTKLVELIDNMCGYRQWSDNFNEARFAVDEAVEKLERDAARYQWLREYLPSDDASCDEAIVAALAPEELDAAIDAARSKQ